MITSYLDATVHIVSRTLDTFNERVVATRTATPARVDWTTKLVRVTNGQDKLAAATVYLAAGAALALTDTIEISGVEHAVLRIRDLRDFGASHIEADIA